MRRINPVLKISARVISALLIICMISSMFWLFEERTSFVRTVNVEFVYEGSGSDDSFTIEKGTALRGAPVPYKPGHIFLGWYIDEALTRSYDISLPISESMKLYAGFMPLSVSTSEVSRELYLRDCTKQTVITVKSELSAEELSEKLVLLDELTGETLKCEISKKSEEYLVYASYEDGHTYTLELSEEVSLSGRPNISAVTLSILPAGEEKLGYSASIVEIPEECPSAERTLQLYTSADVKVGDLVLAGGREKHVFLVREIVDGAKGKCLLLMKPDSSFLGEFLLYGNYSMSLSRGSFEAKETSAYSAVDEEKLLSELLKTPSEDVFAQNGESVVLKEENGLKITLSPAKSEAFGKGADVVEAVYRMPISRGEDMVITEIKVKMLVSPELSLFLQRGSDGKTLADVAVNLRSVSESEVRILSDAGEEIRFSEEEYFQSNPGKDAVGMLTDTMKELLSEKITASVKGFEGAFGELEISVRPSFSLEAEISAVSANMKERRALNESFGVRGYLGELVGYKQVNASAGYAEGSLAGRAECSSGLSFDIAIRLGESDIELLELYAESASSTQATGVFSVTHENGVDEAEGLTFLEMYSGGSAMPKNCIEKASFSRETVRKIGENCLIPANQTFTKNEYFVSESTFDIKHILSEGVFGILPGGNKIHSGVTPDDVVLYFGGALAPYITYDRESGRVTVDPHDGITDPKITLDIYYENSTEISGGSPLPIKRSITLILGDSSDMKDRTPAAEEYEYLAAFIRFEGGMWKLSYEKRSLGDTSGKRFTDETGWNAIYPALGEIETLSADSIEVRGELLSSLRADYTVPEEKSAETLSEVLELADISADVIFVADYKDKLFDVTYKQESGEKTVSYAKNELRGGVSEVVNRERSLSVYEKVFGSWKELSYTDASAAYELEYAPASFTVTVQNADGSFNREEIAFVGELPEFLLTPPTDGEKTGAWLSSEHGNLVSWLEYPQLAKIEKDVTVQAFFGDIYTVTLNLNGGTPIEGSAPQSIRFTAGTYNLDGILPMLTKPTDAINTYEFAGWGSINVTSDSVLTAPFKETPHIYTVILNAGKGKVNGKTKIEFECTYMQLDMLIDKVLEDNIAVRENSATKSYTFTGWNPGKTSAAYTYVYNAQYKESERLYKITITAPDGGMFPDGESVIEKELPYKSKLDGLTLNNYFAKIPSNGPTVKIIDYFMNGEEKVPLGSVLTVEGDINLVVVYKEIENRKFVVEFDAGDGKFSNGQSKLVFEGDYGDPLPEPSDPIAPVGEGFTSLFLGWSAEIPSVFTGDFSVKANYKVEKKVYTVTYFTMDGNVHAVYKVAYGEKIPLPEEPQIEGYDFLGWEGLPESGNVSSADVRVYAKLDKATYKITYLIDGEVYAVEELYFGEKIVTRPYPYKPGYSFTGWKYPAVVTMPEEDITVNGSFEKGKYKVQYVVDDKLYKETEAVYGDNVELIKLPSGAKLWCSSDVEINDGSFLMPSGHIKIYADTRGEEYSISFTVDGTVVKSDKYSFGDKVSLPEVPTDERFTGRWLFRYSDEYKDYEAKMDKEDFEPMTRVVIKRGDYSFGGYMPAANLVAVPELKIENIGSGKDINNNGIDDFTDIVNTAREYILSHPIYESIYYHWNFGYPDDWHGVCTDVIWRAYLGIGVNFKELVDGDIAYGATLGDKNPYKDVMTRPNLLIDFRRVKNLKIYFDNNSTVLTKDTLDPTEWQPGDIVVFSPSHIGICSDKRDSEGLPLIIHHTEGRGAIESDELGRVNIGKYKVTGHYRIDHDRLK